MKKITVDCAFSDGSSHPVTFYIGDSAISKNPIGFQSRWLSDNKGGSVPSGLMDSLVKIKKISDDHNLPFEDLYDYVVQEMENGRSLKEISVQNQRKFESVKNSQNNNEKE